MNLRMLAEHVALWIDQRLERARIWFICLAVLAISLAMLTVSFCTSDGGQTMFGPPLGADFAGFYTAGTILNLPATADRNRLYDFQLHDALYHQLLPHMPEQEKLPYVHPPFVAQMFEALAWLPYEWAFGVWLLLSAGFYVGGLALVWRALPALQRADRSTALLLAVAFEPFIMECWLGGQLSALGLFCVALAFACDQARRPVTSGVALGLCLYKPTLLVLLVPMMIMARRWRMLGSFALTGLGLATISLLGAGYENTADYLHTLLGFARTTTGGTSLQLRLWKYVDLNSFFCQLLGGHSALNWVLIFIVAVAPLVLLGISWRRLDKDDDALRHLTWAATLAWTPILNLYVGIYDAILVVPAALMMVSVVDAGAQGRQARSFRLLLCLVFVIPWMTQPLARATGCQLATVVLAALAAFSLLLRRRMGRTSAHRHAEATLASPVPALPVAV